MWGGISLWFGWLPMVSGDAACLPVLTGHFRTLSECCLFWYFVHLKIDYSSFLLLTYKVRLLFETIFLVYAGLHIFIHLRVIFNSWSFCLYFPVLGYLLVCTSMCSQEFSTYSNASPWVYICHWQTFFFLQFCVVFSLFFRLPPLPMLLRI